MPARDEVLWTSLAGDEEETQPRHVLIQSRQERRDTAQRGDVVGLEEGAQVLADQCRAAWLRDQGGPGDPWHPDLLDGEVKGHRHALIDPVVAVQSVRLGCDSDEVADAGVLDRDALRATGRAGRVDDVAEVVHWLGRLRGPQA